MIAQDQINQVWQLLGQPSNTPLIGLSSGVTDIAPGDYTVQPDDAILYLLTQGQNEVARTILPVRSSTSAVVPNGSDQVQPYNTLTDASGRVLYRPQSMSVGSFQLTPGRYGDFQNWYLENDPSTSSPPAFADLNTSAVLANPATADITINIVGFFLPLPLTADNSPVDQSIDEEYARLICYWTCWQIGERIQDNPDVTQRGPIWMKAYSDGRLNMYQRVISNDPTLSAIFPPVPELAAPPNIPPKRNVVL